MPQTFIGIDNGVTGSIGIISDAGAICEPVPIRKELNYTKTKRWITRVDSQELRRILEPYAASCVVYLERPMVNPGRFQATASALRALEAVLIVLEELRIPFTFVDSKQWQRALLPSGLKKQELKRASLSVGRRLFPSLTFDGDADGILIAEYARRQENGVRAA